MLDPVARQIEALDKALVDDSSPRARALLTVWREYLLDLAEAIDDR